MNYLAHVFLGEQSAHGMVGALFGDFVKGPVDDTLPPAVARGIRLHRAIDQFTDAHASHRASRGRFVPPRRRFAGIIVDICYDHFLCHAWHRFSRRPLPVFTAEVYQALFAYTGELPGTLGTILPRMAERDWLGSYRDFGRLELTLDGVSGRVRRGHEMMGAIVEVKENYADLRDDFEIFFPQLIDFAEHWKFGEGIEPQAG